MNSLEQRREDAFEARRYRRQCDIDNVREHAQRKQDDLVLSEIAQKLKSKNGVEEDDLATLLSILYRATQLTPLFEGPGSLQGLIREFTGNNVRKQLLAAGCLCNLALGPPQTCTTIAKACGAYFLTYLDHQNVHILKLCLFALGNLLASNKKVSSILDHSQGLSSNLMILLNKNFDQQTMDVIMYTFGHLLMSDSTLSLNQIQDLTRSVLKCNSNSNQKYWLLFLLTEKDAAYDVFKSKSTLKDILMALSTQTEYATVKSNLIITNCLIRIAANIIGMQAFNPNDLLQMLVEENFIKSIKILLRIFDEDINKETVWLVGNIYNLSIGIKEKEIFFTCITSALSDCVGYSKKTLFTV